MYCTCTCYVYFSFNLNKFIYLLSPLLSVGRCFRERFVTTVQIFLPEKLERFQRMNEFIETGFKTCISEQIHHATVQRIKLAVQNMRLNDACSIHVHSTFKTLFKLPFCCMNGIHYQLTLPLPFLINLRHAHPRLDFIQQFCNSR